MSNESEDDTTVSLPPLPQRRALQAITLTVSGTHAAASLGVGLEELARDLARVRAHYGVTSTRAAVEVARRLGHLAADLDR